MTPSNGATLAGNGSTLILPDGIASVTLTVTPADDARDRERRDRHRSRSARAAPYTISGAVSQTGTIADNDKPTVNVASLSKVEGNGGTGTPTSFVVTVTLSAPAPYAITVTLATARPTPLPAGTAAATGAATLTTTGADYQTATFTVTFAAGQTSATVTVKVVGDKAKESNEVFNVNVTNSGGAIAGTNGTITILNDESPLNATAVGTAIRCGVDGAVGEHAGGRARSGGAVVDRRRRVRSPLRGRHGRRSPTFPARSSASPPARRSRSTCDAAGWGWFTDGSDVGRRRSDRPAQRARARARTRARPRARRSAE